jgi:hypothetical protein
MEPSVAGQADDGHTGDQSEEVRRGSAGRLDLVLARLRRSDEAAFVLHVRLRPGARSFAHRFREGDALRMMGLRPNPACPFFPVACFYGGCYFRVLGPAGDPDAEAHAVAVFERALQDLPTAAERLLASAWLAEDIGLPLQG